MAVHRAKYWWVHPRPSIERVVSRSQARAMRATSRLGRDGRLAWTRRDDEQVGPELLHLVVLSSSLHNSTLERQAIRYGRATREHNRLRCHLSSGCGPLFSLYSCELTSDMTQTGALCAHWTADALTLWTAPLTDAHLASAGAYYAVLAKMPVWLSRTFGAIVVAGGTTLLWSLGDGRAGNIMFDGASICAYLGCHLS
jgi:hypothetical protein